MIIVVGLAVDYSAHLVHAYNTAPVRLRRERVEFAARTMGTSVLAGALTTFLASTALWFTTITFFVNFGTFMALTVLFSFMFAFTFVMPLAMLMGPEDGGWWRRKASPDASEVYAPNGGLDAGAAPNGDALDEEAAHRSKGAH